MQEKVIRRLHDVLGYGLELKERIEQGEVPRVEVEHDKLRTILLGDGELAQNAAYNGELAGLPQQATGTAPAANAFSRASEACVRRGEENSSIASRSMRKPR